jgi:serine/threonine protein kinase
MGINMIEQKNGEQVFEYKFPEFLNDNNEISSNSNDYEILQVLGAGAFSCVLKVKSKINKQIYAMKKVDMNKILEEMNVDRKYFENEIHFLQNLRSNFVCKCYTIFQEDNFLFFIMEFMNNGDLQTFYKANKALQKQIPEDKMWDIFFKSISGLKYIHEKGLIHRDIKLENLFLDDNFNIKIGDFNVSATIDFQAAQNFADEQGDQGDLQNMISGQTVVGTAGYMAPEVKRNERMDSKYGPKADVFSMGVSFFELCYGDKPYQRVNKNQYYQKKLYSIELNKIVDQMIEKDDRRRPSSEESYYVIKKYFINKYVKNSSVDATINCFYQLPNFKQFFFENKNKNLYLNNQFTPEQGDNNEIEQVNHKVEIGNSIFEVIQSLNTNNKDLIDDRMYELRNSITNAGLNAKENEEIEPGLFISFFLRILNSVLNEITMVDENSFNADELMVLSSSFKFKLGQEEFIFNQFLNSYNKKLLSLISRNFFNSIKIKKECKNCKSVGYSFSMFNFIPFNVDILINKCQKKDNFHLKDGFDCLLNDRIELNKTKRIFCNKCNDFTDHYESKTFYHTAKDLIIIFDRGENFSNKTFINFDEQLVLNQKEVERYNEVRYDLASVLVKLENNKEKEEFVSFMNYGNNNWVSNKNRQNPIKLDDVKKSGIIIALFYYSNDNRLILQSQASQNMYNQPNNYQNNNMYNNQGMQNNFSGNGNPYGNNNGNGFNNNGPNYPNNNGYNNGTNYPNNNGYNNGTNYPNNNGYNNGPNYPNNNGYNNGPNYPNNNGYNNGTNYPNNNGPNYNGNNYQNNNGTNYPNNNGYNNGSNYQNNNGPNYNGNNNGYNNGNNYQNNNGPNYNGNNYQNNNGYNNQNNNGYNNGNNYQNNNGYNNGNNYQNNNGYNNGNNYQNNNGYNNGNNYPNNNGYNNGNNNNGFNNMSMNNMANSNNNVGFNNSMYMNNNNMSNSNNNVRSNNMGMNNSNTNIGFNNNMGMNNNMNNLNNNMPNNNNNMAMNNNNMNNSNNNIPINNSTMSINNNNMTNSNNNVGNSMNMGSNIYGMGNSNNSYGPAPAPLNNQNNSNQNYRNN